MSNGMCVEILHRYIVIKIGEFRSKSFLIMKAKPQTE